MRELRIERGLTQQEVADRAGLSSTWISELERGRRANPAWNTVMRLVDALEVSIVEFATRVEKRRTRTRRRSGP